MVAEITLSQAVLDVSLMLCSLTLSLVFLLFHIVVVRVIGDRGVFVWLARVFVGVGFFGAIILFGVFRHEPLSIAILLPVVVLILYALVTFSYILAIFGITITSVRIQILSTIYGSGGNGMTIQELMKEYNRATLFRQRLERLLTSGEVKQKKGKYYLSHSVSPFIIHMKMQELFRRIYNG